MCWFPVFCARRRNESRDAETLLVIGQANSLKQLRISAEGQRNVVFITKHQTWGHYSTNVSDRLRLLATGSITITNKQNHNVIDHDYIESNHDYNRDYICLETCSEKKTFAVLCKYIFRQHTILINAINEITNLLGSSTEK